MPKKKLNRERIRKPAPRHQKEALLGKDWRQELRENPDRVELKADDSSVGSEESYDAADYSFLHFCFVCPDQMGESFSQEGDLWQTWQVLC